MSELLKIKRSQFTNIPEKGLIISKDVYIPPDKQITKENLANLSLSLGLIPKKSYPKSTIRNDIYQYLLNLGYTEVSDGLFSRPTDVRLIYFDTKLSYDPSKPLQLPQHFIINDRKLDDFINVYGLGDPEQIKGKEEKRTLVTEYLGNLGYEKLKNPIQQGAVLDYYRAEGDYIDSIPLKIYTLFTVEIYEEFVNKNLPIIFTPEVFNIARNINYNNVYQTWESAVLNLGGSDENGFIELYLIFMSLYHYKSLSNRIVKNTDSRYLSLKLKYGNFEEMINRFVNNVQYTTQEGPSFDQWENTYKNYSYDDTIFNKFIVYLLYPKFFSFTDKTEDLIRFYCGYVIRYFHTIDLSSSIRYLQLINCSMNLINTIANLYGLSINYRSLTGKQKNIWVTHLLLLVPQNPIELYIIDSKKWKPREIREKVKGIGMHIPEDVEQKDHRTFFLTEVASYADLFLIPRPDFPDGGTDFELMNTYFIDDVLFRNRRTLLELIKNLPNKRIYSILLYDDQYILFEMDKLQVTYILPLDLPRYVQSLAEDENYKTNLKLIFKLMRLNPDHSEIYKSTIKNMILFNIDTSPLETIITGSTDLISEFQDYISILQHIFLGIQYTAGWKGYPHHHKKIQDYTSYKMNNYAKDMFDKIDVNSDSFTHLENIFITLGDYLRSKIANSMTRFLINPMGGTDILPKDLINMSGGRRYQLYLSVIEFAKLLAKYNNIFYDQLKNLIEVEL